MITAYGSEKVAVQAMKLGAVDYLPKPFTPAQIRLLVEQVTARRATQSRRPTSRGSDSPCPS